MHWRGSNTSNEVVVFADSQSVELIEHRIIGNQFNILNSNSIYTIQFGLSWSLETQLQVIHHKPCYSQQTLIKAWALHLLVTVIQKLIISSVCVDMAMIVSITVCSCPYTVEAVVATNVVMWNVNEKIASMHSCGVCCV